MILENGEYAQGKFIPEGATIIDSSPPTSAHKWKNGEWKFQGFSQEEANKRMRKMRSHYLSLTDWWGSSDLIMNQEQKDYRQALRDLPATASPEIDEAGQLVNITWPTKPE